ncbi:30S ribosomal protein S8e [Candidatus Woesearchaeota archaeon]|nr:30S ribosomal protein S8e [Candidatus Woesearchaeota archaeon]
MVIIQGRKKSMPTGKKIITFYRGKRLYEIGRDPASTKLGTYKMEKVRTKGAGEKQRLTGMDIANLYDPKSKKYSKVKIKTVTDNPANRHFVRRNIITKGSIVDTEAGKARVTSRPGQDGIINAVLI